jgi:3'(2'), 5'-bisphosphate nucleotidase
MQHMDMTKTTATGHDDAALLHVAETLAWKAAEIILGLRARGCETRSKSDASPVTDADHESEALLIAGLQDATPNIPVVAEEAIFAGYSPPRAGRTYWLVDPLDGTRDFVALRDSFTVNIGLIRDGRPVLGVVAVPASAELFSGLIGTGAWKQDGSGRHRISVRTPPASGLVVLSSRVGTDEHRIRTLLAKEDIASITMVSSAVKFCRLAEGSADLYARFGRTMEWDTAGPEAVLIAAGGTLTQMDGTPMQYEKPGWANPPFVCRGSMG